MKPQIIEEKEIGFVYLFAACECPDPQDCDALYDNCDCVNYVMGPSPGCW